jgi:hypothetical protein
MPIGAEFGQFTCCLSYGFDDVESLVQLCHSRGVRVPVATAAGSAAAALPEWFEVARALVQLDLRLLARHTGKVDAEELVAADLSRLEGQVWELQVKAIAGGLAQFSVERGSVCPPLQHTVALSTDELVGTLEGGSTLLTGDGAASRRFGQMEFRVLQTRCKTWGLPPTAEEVQAEAQAQVGGSSPHTRVQCGHTLDRRLCFCICVVF